MRSQGLLIARLEQELAGYMQDMKKPILDFQRYVVDPETGLVVKHRHLERNVETLQQAQGEMVKDFLKIPNIIERLETLETAAETRTATKRYIVRDVLIYGALTIVSSVITVVALKKLGL